MPRSKICRRANFFVLSRLHFVQHLHFHGLSLASSCTDIPVDESVEAAADAEIDKAALKKAFRKQSLKFHPDKVYAKGAMSKQAATERYQAIINARTFLESCGQKTISGPWVSCCACSVFFVLFLFLFLFLQRARPHCYSNLFPLSGPTCSFRPRSKNPL